MPEVVIEDENVFVPTGFKLGIGEWGITNEHMVPAVTLIIEGVMLAAPDQPLRLPAIVLTDKEAKDLSRQIELKARELRRTN